MGLSALFVPTDKVMRRPSHRGTNDRTGSTFFCIYPGRIIKNQSKGSCFDFMLRTIYKDEEKVIFAMLLVAIVDFM